MDPRLEEWRLERAGEVREETAVRRADMLLYYHSYDDQVTIVNSRTNNRLPKILFAPRVPPML